MVCLDQSEADTALITAAKNFAQSPDALNIYFFTVVQSLELPQAVHEQYPDLIAPIDETIEKSIWDTLDSVFKGIEIDISVDVREGNVTDQILKWSSEKDMDLILMGSKPIESGSGHHREKVVNAAHCSVGIVPQHCVDVHVKRILLPTDFSSASREAFKKAENFAKVLEASITIFHSYEVPTGYHTTGKTYEEFADIMLGHAKNDCDQFISTNSTENVEINCAFALDKHGTPHELILKAANDIKADVVVLGSKGRTGLSSVLLGSVAAKLIKAECPIPVLIVKGKNENLGLLKAILQL